MNPDLSRLKPYPFDQLNQLLDGVTPGAQPFISLALGEPRHQPPDFIIEAFANTGLLTEGVATYPPTRGLPNLRAAIADFVRRRFSPADPDPDFHVLPVNGTREALFAIAQTVCDPTSKPLTLLPNPFYQIYEGAALLAGTTPHYLPCGPERGFQPDINAISDDLWQRVGLIYLCNPGNPQGALMSTETLQAWISKALEHQAVLVMDECYSEIYKEETNPPPGLLQAAAMMGNKDFKQCLTFNSLSKRSNLPGLRSGFVAGDADLIRSFLLYRTYHGSAMPVHTQKISALAWQDDDHVRANRAQYTAKIQDFVRVLAPFWPMQPPAASFYLWPETPINDLEFTQRLMRNCNIKVLPGQFLSRSVNGQNPGLNRVRLALVADSDDCLEAANRIADNFQHLS
ncbi:MAG: succinyldiaminopimelate transaminase [Proteobacteria bacterium]|nr:succinyldiaminopimelate transaminase [Pseudomonadota bacterium]